MQEISLSNEHVCSKQQLTCCLLLASQALLLRSDCQALLVEVQTSRQQLDEEKDRGRQLEERCQQLKEQTGEDYQGIKTSLLWLNAAVKLLRKEK